FEAKYNDLLLACIKGEISSYGVLISGPAFTALVQTPRSSRVLIQMSRLPTPLDRSETKYKVRPSAERDGCDSHCCVFTLRPRFFGVDHESPTFTLSYKSQLPMPSRPEQEVKIKRRPSAEIAQV